MLAGLAPEKVEMEVAGSLRGRDGRGSPKDKIRKRKKKENKIKWRSVLKLPDIRMRRGLVLVKIFKIK